MKHIVSISSTLIVLLFSQCTKEHVALDNTPKLKDLSLTEQELIHTSNVFAVNLFQAIHQVKGDENIFISPLSVGFALNMTTNGATGETKEEMKQVLDIESLSDTEANAAVQKLTEMLLNMDKKTRLSIANAIWHHDDLTLEANLHKVIEDQYMGKIEGLNFADPSTKEVINGWVENETQGKIKNLIEEISPLHRMFLVNAIYFKGDWQYKFDKERTSEGVFTLASGQKVPVQMMYSNEVKLRTYQNKTFQLVELPYGNGQFSMVILLPHIGKTTDEVMSLLAAEDIQSWINQADTLMPHLYLPKFTSEFKMDLVEPLISMGMSKAFSNAAEFSGFFNEIKSLAIGEVIHQAYIEVNEEGTEAAAATSVGIVLTSIGNTPTIRIDRPFVYFIREKHTEAILFAGKMTNPSN